MQEARLQRLRIKSNLTQRELGDVIGTSHDAISDWERGKRYPSHKNGQKLVEFFHAPSLEWLMTAEDEPA